LTHFSAAFFVIASPDWIILGAALSLAVVTSLFIFFIQPDASDLAPRRSKLDQLLERRDTLYDNLRDLRFEFRSGKYAENDYEAMKTSLETEAAVVIAEIDEITESQVRRPRGVKPAASERGAQ
jgi:low affinity Fe/Cu permease